jgi:hypothetical protein
MGKQSIMGLKVVTFREEAANMEIASKNDKPSYGTAMSLRIWHPSVLSSEITNALGLMPSLLNDVGARRQTPAGQILEGVYAQTYWLYKFDFPQGIEVEECIAKALESLSSKREFLTYIISTGGRCELFIGVFLERGAGIELDGNLVRRVADVGLGLSFDVYLPGT